jgi:hypothetical protein
MVCPGAVSALRLFGDASLDKLHIGILFSRSQTPRESTEVLMRDQPSSDRQRGHLRPALFPAIKGVIHKKKVFQNKLP